MLHDFLKPHREVQVIGDVRMYTRDPDTHKIGEVVEQHNTISSVVGEVFNTAIRQWARQGDMPGFTNPFNCLYLFNRPLTIDPVFKTVDLYNLDAPGTGFKPALTHPDIVGYNVNLNTQQETNVKAGIYDTVMSDKLRFKDTTARVWIFSKEKAVGKIRSVMLSSGLTYGNTSNYSALGGCGNRQYGSNAYKKLCLLPNGNYICARDGAPSILLEFNPAEGIPKTNAYDTKLTSVNMSLLAAIPSGTADIPSATFFYISNTDSRNGTISLIKGNMLTSVCEAPVVIPIKKINNSWFNVEYLFSDDKFIYSVHRESSNYRFFITKIDPATMTVVEYYDYIDNTIRFSSAITYDESNKKYILYASYESLSSSAIFFAADSLTNIYNCKELGHLTLSYYSTNGIYNYGPIIKGGLAFSPDFGRITPYHNFGAVAVLADDSFIKPAEKELVVQYNHTIVY